MIFLVIAIGIYELYLLYFLYKNFTVDQIIEGTRKNLKKVRNIFLIIVAVIVTIACMYALTETSNPLYIILCFEVMFFIWYQALFSG